MCFPGYPPNQTGQAISMVSEIKRHIIHVIENMKSNWAVLVSRFLRIVYLNGRRPICMNMCRFLQCAANIILSWSCWCICSSPMPGRYSILMARRGLSGLSLQRKWPLLPLLTNSTCWWRRYMRSISTSYNKYSLSLMFKSTTMDLFKVFWGGMWVMGRRVV